MESRYNIGDVVFYSSATFLITAAISFCIGDARARNYYEKILWDAELRQAYVQKLIADDALENIRAEKDQ